MYKLLFKNPIGKILYDSFITKTGSKMKEIAEKAFKNQIKIAVTNEDCSK
jgi:hypothetical protein